MPEARVRLMHYDPRWRQEFEQTRSSVLHSCAGWVTAVEHIGSTAISGLIARPTIDVVAAVDSADALQPAALLIEGLNYRRLTAPQWCADAVWLVKPRYPLVEAPEPTHCVWLVQRDSATWNRTLQVRDWLRQHPAAAIDFEEAKVARWRSGEGDATAYEADKAIFFAHLEDQIDAEG